MASDPGHPLTEHFILESRDNLSFQRKYKQTLGGTIHHSNTSGTVDRLKWGRLEMTSYNLAKGEG
jgi:hypothetical protein